MSFHGHVRTKPSNAVVINKTAISILPEANVKHQVVHVSFRHHIRLRECPPGTAAVPLADLTAENIAELYVPGGLRGADAAATVTGPAGVAPAEASGTDLPVPNLGDIGAQGGPVGGGGPGFGGLPVGASGGTGVIGLPGGFGGGGGGGHGTGGGTPPPGTGSPFPPVITPPGGGVTGVPEPATWALMLVGVGLIGASARGRKRAAARAA